MTEITPEIITPTPVEVDININTLDHNKLINRDLENQHPISSITGLQEALNAGGATPEAIKDSLESLEGDNRLDASAIKNIPSSLSDLSDDSTHRLVTDTEKTIWNNKLSSYTETDPVFISSPANNITNDHITVLNNTSGTNTGDETQESIKTKLGSASASTDGYLTSTDWNTFNGKQSALGYTPEDVSNKVTSISVSSTDTQYPSAKCVFDIVGDISATLDAISGEVI